MKGAKEILMELVAIPSVSSMSNRPVIDYCARYLPAEQWSFRSYCTRDRSGTEKVNLVAITRNATGRTAELAFVCHTDTVPFETTWKEAVRPAVRKGNLYGRGSCDVKGFLACVLDSLGRSDLCALAKPIALVLTADEEVGCEGAKYLVAKKAIRSRYAIIGEPTGLRPVYAGKGYALAEIVVRGKEAHSAYPRRGRSAIYDASRVLARLESVARKARSRKNRRFDPPYTTVNVGLIQGGTAKNIVPGECRITVEWRPIPGQDREWVAGLIRRELVRLKRSVPGLKVEMSQRRSEPSFESAGGRGLVTFLESLTRRKAATVSFGTEAAHLNSVVGEAVVFGPGDMTTAHKTGEFVPVAQLEECTRYIDRVIGRICGRDSNPRVKRPSHAGDNVNDGAIGI
jgi:acetylornithine deacetylase